MEQSWAFKTTDFGNTWLDNAAEVTAPAPISWLPDTPLGYALALLLTLLLLRGLYRHWRRWQRNGYRRDALRQLQQLQQRYAQGERDCIRQLPVVLRQCALVLLPREAVVALQGETWLQFLQDSAPAASPIPAAIERTLAQLAYLPPQQRQALPEPQVEQLFHWCERWISGHQAPRNGTDNATSGGQP